MNIELISFDEPTETRRFEKGRFDLYRVGPAILGRATHGRAGGGPSTSLRLWEPASCQVEHVGLVA